MARGTLRIYLGAAPGVGKTYRMLEEGRRRHARGTDVVIGIVETHGRAHTAALLQDGGLEAVPRRRIEHRGSTFEELDLDALIARRPQVALVDEFAHTNVPGSRNEKRWQDVDELLDHGIDVVSTLNIQHLESLNDVVREITGTVQRETVPDEIVRRAEQVELVDMAAQALRRRMAHGNVYPADKVDAALANYFREGNLLSLRELALLWTAGRVDEALRRYRDLHAIDAPWETHERVVVGLDGRPGADLLLRRGARIAERSGGELITVHVARADGLAGAGSSEELVRLERLTRELGGRYELVVGESPADALVDFARSVQATQLVIGSRRRSRLGRLRRGAGTAERTVPASGSIDVHIVSQDEETDAGGGDARLGGERGLGALRTAAGIGGGLLLIWLLTVVLHQVNQRPPVQTTYLLYLAVVVIAAAIGGVLPAALTAIVAALVVNWYFTEPIETFDVQRPANALALVLFAAFGVALGAAVEVGVRRRQQAERAAAEAQLLVQLTSGMLRRTTPGAVLEQMRASFGLRRVELEVRDDAAPGGWRQVRAVGTGTAASDGPGEGNQAALLEIDERRRVVAIGPPLPASDRRVLAAFATQAGVALDTATLAGEAATARSLAQADAARRALLASVGHDLRTPLAGIKAAVSSLRQADVEFSPDDEAELLAAIEESADRLHELVRDLLDMSRLQADVVTVAERAVWIDEVLAPALVDHDREGGAAIRVEVDERLPPVLADPVLLERILANVIGNAVRHGAGADVLVRAEALGDRSVQVRVVDRGPGVPEAQRARMFEPFQRLDVDRDPTGGVGLGLAVARGFAEAIGAVLEADDTPGGGLTMVLTLPQAHDDRGEAGDEPAPRAATPEATA
ncbi:MAG: sensor histidine kinase KdpD [Solirubrobacteraceae bacterium]|nr:sensor histidine kinase KdpD [Solirubrobacteraceae bacterium]